MNDVMVSADMNIDMLTASRVGIDVDDFEYLINGTLFSSLTVIWGCNCHITRRYDRRSVEVSIRCPALLAAGIEQKLERIFSNPADRTAYEVDSYPQDRMLNVNRIAADRIRQGGMPMTAPPDYGPQALLPSDDHSHHGFADSPAVMGMTVPDAPRPKVKYVEVPAPERKRIVKLT